MKSINEIQSIAKEQDNQFIKEGLVTNSKDIDAAIKKNKLSIFSFGNTISSQTLVKTKKRN